MDHLCGPDVTAGVVMRGVQEESESDSMWQEAKKQSKRNVHILCYMLALKMEEAATNQRMYVVPGSW